MGQQENGCTWALEKNLWYVHMTCHFVLPFSVLVGRRSHHASLTQAKRDLKWKRLGHRIIHEKTIWKPGISETDKASRGIIPGLHQRGCLQHPIWTPSCNGQHADTHWVMAYSKLNPSWKMEVSKVLGWCLENVTLNPLKYKDS